MHPVLSEISCANEAATTQVAVLLADLVKAGDLIALTGDLGAGKTTFARAFIRSLLGDAMAEVPSPTFTLVQAYETPNFEIYHTDLYRLKNSEEVYDLGIDDDRDISVLLVEWPDRMPEDWWRDALEIRLKRPKGSPAGEDEARTISFCGDAGYWTSRVAELRP